MRVVRHFIVAVIALCAVQLVFVTACFAQEANKITKITKIKVKGGERTEDSTVISYSELAVGQDYSKAKENAALKSLYNTGFFSNVSIAFDQGVITISIEENPIVGSVNFKGNKALKTENILPEISLKPRGYFSANKVQSDVARILELYSKMGTFSVTVDPKISKLPQNRVNVLFHIHEGKKVKIEKISFIGNKRFTSNDLRQVLVSKENRIFNFFRLNYYSPDSVEYDKVLLSRFYSSKGYANFTVVSVNAEVMPTDMERVYITYVIDEGLRYDVGKVNLNNEISSMKNEELLKLINIKSGEVFNGAAVEEINTKIIKYLAEKGFPFVKVDYDYSLHKEKQLVDISYKISKAPKVYIGKINISGNTKTYDYVIRREFRLSEGDPYNGFLVDRSKQRVENLDYFKKVDVTPTVTNKPDVVDLTVKVQEKSTATAKFSIGYSTTNGPLAAINFTEINWLGRGQRLSLGLEKSAFTTGANFGYSEPHFMGTEVEAGGNLGFSIERNDAKNAVSGLGADRSHVPFNSESYTAGVFVNYDIAEYLNHTVDYSAVVSRFSAANRTGYIPLIVQADLGRVLASSIGHTLSYNVADSAIKPTSGYILSLNQTLAGLGGTVKNLRHVLKGAYYYPVMEDLTLKVAAEGGHIHRITNSRAVRITDNFHLGEFSFKGFEFAGVGPRDKGLGQKALGGVYYYKGVTELMFPFPGVSRDLDLSGAVFCEFGSLWDIDIPKNLRGRYTRANYYNSRRLRASAGLGVIWITRMGPLRIDYARAFKKERFDETRELLFSMQTAL
jgi:outer membrane protein insertion porin family